VWVWLLSACLVLAAFAVLGVALWRLYRLVMALGRDVAAAAERLGESAAALESLAPARPDDRPHRP
jgi:hypothetical protein